VRLEHVGRLDRELGDVFGAIGLVASGRADRVEVCNLRHARRVVTIARETCSDLPIAIRAVPQADPARIDVVVERVPLEVSH